MTSIAAVDWLAIAGVKNSTSSSYNSPDDVLSGITMPDEMAGWLRKTGWTIQSQAASITRQDLAKLQAASQAYTASKTVFLFVKAKAIDKAAKNPWWGVDHWIVLASSIQVRESSGKTWVNITDLSLKGKDIMNYQIGFDAYTWGEVFTIGTMNARSTSTIADVDDFLDYFYGYISATPPR